MAILNLEVNNAISSMDLDKFGINYSNYSNNGKVYMEEIMPGISKW